MIKTAEAVSLGHPDKTADYISSYILDRFLEQDENVRYAVEVMIKGNTVVLGGEVSSTFVDAPYEKYATEALREIGYDERYADIWGKNAPDVRNIKVINLISRQSGEIAQGVLQDGWGDQGVFVGYACKGNGNISQELYLARKLNRALYERAKKSSNLGLDIKTQITLDEDGIKTAIVAIPMLKDEDLSAFVTEVLGQKPQRLIINGTGNYLAHSSIADCGITGRKLACDFYEAAAPIGGGSPWTKDATKADLTLNLYARKLALDNLSDYDEVWVYLSSCIGQACLPSATLKWRKGEKYGEEVLPVGELRPSVLIKKLGLNKPVYAKMCREGLVR
jgi:S-adenosylmethionine synthetase